MSSFQALVDTDQTVRLIVDDLCTACGACIPTCPTGALRRAPGKPRVVQEKCVFCMECIEICPRGAISEVRQ